VSDGKQQRDRQEHKVAIAVFSVSLVFAVVVASLSVAGMRQGHWWPGAIWPYGFAGCILVNAAAIVPLSYALSVLCDQWLTGRTRYFVGVICLLLGLCLMIATVTTATDVENAFSNVGPMAHAMVRVIWPTLMTVCWLCGLMLIFPWRGSTRPRTNTYLTLLVSLLVASVVPAVYTTHLTRQQSAMAEARRLQGQTLRAWYLVDRLSAMASTHLVGGRTLAQQRKTWGQELEQARVELLTPLATDADTSVRIRHARNLVAWAEKDEELDLAVETLEPVAANHLRALLLKTSIHGSRKEWPAVVHDCALAISRLEQMQVTQTVDRSLVEQFYRRWAEALRMMGRYRQAEEVLVAGLANWPSSKGYFHFQLAHHHGLGGRPRQAMEQYREAAQADITYEALADQAITHLRSDSPACLLRTVRPVKR